MKIKIITLFFSLFVFSFCVKAQTINCDSTSHMIIVKSVEVMPSYPGGDERLFEFFAMNLQYPAVARENNIQGTVIVNVVIDTSGKICCPKVVKPLGGGCDEEALRVINLIPPLIPGMQNGKHVMVYYNFPVNFKLNGVKPKKEKKN